MMNPDQIQCKQLQDKKFMKILIVLIEGFRKNIIIKKA